MIPFHSILPEIAQREVRCVHIGVDADATDYHAPPPDECVYLDN